MTARLGAFLMVMVGLYLILVISVISSCFGEMLACGFLNRMIPDLSFIPLISRPVDFLVWQTKFTRAQAVLEAYSFTWALALVWLLLMTLIAAFWTWRMTKAEAEQIVEIAEDRGHYMNMGTARKGSMIVGAMACGLLLWLVYGSFDFDGYARSNFFTNAVHTRNRDFYTPAIAWAFFMLTFVLLLMNMARAHAEKLSGRKPLWIKL